MWYRVYKVRVMMMVLQLTKMVVLPNEMVYYDATEGEEP